MVCAATPCQRKVPLGKHRVTMQKERYLADQQEVNLTAKSTHHVSLQADFATLSIGGVAGVRVLMDGKELGTLPLREVPVDSEHTSIDDPAC